MYTVQYALLEFAEEPTVRIRFDAGFKSPKALKDWLSVIPRTEGKPDLEKALQKAAELFQRGSRSEAQKILVVIVDKETVGDENVIRQQADKLELSRIKVGSGSLLVNVKSVIPSKVDRQR